MTPLRPRCLALAAAVFGVVSLGGCASSDEPVAACRDVPDAPSNCPPRERWSPEWNEASFALPPLPEARNLVPIEAPSGKTGFEYLIDRASVSRGDDGVMRYTVVVRSQSGADNIFHEGIRCETDQVRTYGYASRQGEFRPLAGDWKEVAVRGIRGYQVYLLNQIMCDRYGFPWDPENVAEALSTQYTAGGVRIERFCGNQMDCEPTGRRFE